MMSTKRASPKKYNQINMLSFGAKRVRHDKESRQTKAAFACHVVGCLPVCYLLDPKGCALPLDMSFNHLRHFKHACIYVCDTLSGATPKKQRKQQGFAIFPQPRPLANVSLRRTEHPSQAKCHPGGCETRTRTTT